MEDGTPTGEDPSQTKQLFNFGTFALTPARVNMTPAPTSASRQSHQQNRRRSWDTSLYNSKSPQTRINPSTSESPLFHTQIGMANTEISSQTPVKPVQSSTQSMSQTTQPMLATPLLHTQNNVADVAGINNHSPAESNDHPLTLGEMPVNIDTSVNMDTSQAPTETNFPPVSQIQTTSEQTPSEQNTHSASNTFTHPTSSNTIHPNLPSYEPINMIPNAQYNGIDGVDLVDEVERIYNNVVKWKKNLFQVPSGQHGKSFLKLLSEWMKNFNDNTCFQGIALKIYMVIPSLLLQKPSRTSKSKDHTKALAERLKLWNEGKLGTLFKDCLIIQKKLTTAKKRSPEDVSRIFSRLMFTGKIKAALKFLDSNTESGVLPPTDEVIDLLHEKHPQPATIQPNTLFNGPLEPVSHAYFADIDEQTILKAALRTKGSAGPSHFDSDQYSRVLCSKHFKTEGKELREQISIFAKKIATQPIDPQSLEAYTSCRLIPLNKNPGVRPIGVGEVLRRIVGKTIAWSLSEEIQVAAGPLQVSSGLKAGAEAAIHAMRDIFEADNHRRCYFGGCIKCIQQPKSTGCPT